MAQEPNWRLAVVNIGDYITDEINKAQGDLNACLIGIGDYYVSEGEKEIPQSEVLRARKLTARLEALVECRSLAIGYLSGLYIPVERPAPTEAK